MKKHGVIFDCDGTLVDSLGFAMDSMNYALDEIGADPRSPEEIKKFFGRSADRIFFGLLGDQKKADAAFESYMIHQTGLAPKMKLFDGIQELLEELHSRHIPMAVVTGRHQRDMEAVLTPHQIHKYFKILIADNQLTNSKPAPDGILLAAKTLNLDAANTFYVGDSVVDLQAAKSAGAKAVAALWDELVDLNAMKREKPFALLNHPLELLAKLV